MFNKLSERGCKLIKAKGFHLIVNKMQAGQPVVFNELDVIAPLENPELFKKIYGLVYAAPDGQSFVIEVVFGDGE